MQLPPTSSDDECSRAVMMFTKNALCQISYEEAFDPNPRDPTCDFGREALCEGECAERAKAISCYCRDGVRRFNHDIQCSNTTIVCVQLIRRYGMCVVY